MRIQVKFAYIVSLYSLFRSGRLFLAESRPPLAVFRFLRASLILLLRLIKDLLQYSIMPSLTSARAEAGRVRVVVAACRSSRNYERASVRGSRAESALIFVGAQ